MGLTVAVLSWGAEKTLYNTLKSYAYFDMTADQKIALLQEGTPEQESICRYFRFQPISLPVNIGIARGYSRLLDEAKEENFLFLENDWQLIDYPHAEIKIGMNLLDAGDVDYIRYRSRSNPGHPLWTRQFENNEYTRPSHLLDSIHWTDPDKFIEITSREFKFIRFMDYNLQSDDDFISPPVDTTKWYFTTSKYANWTNNPHMARTEFLHKYIQPRLGTRDLEVDIQGWWEGSYFRVAQGPGLFTHNRID